MTSETSVSLTPFQRRQLARYADWQRPSWVAMSNREVKPWELAGLLVGRVVPGGSPGSMVWEYRLTPAGHDAAIEERTADA